MYVVYILSQNNQFVKAFFCVIPQLFFVIVIVELMHYKANLLENGNKNAVIE